MKTYFKPSVHGWRFANSFDLQLKPLGLPYDVPGSYGFCGGLSHVALNRYFDRKPIPNRTDSPTPGDELYAELLNAQIDSMRQDNLAAAAIKWQQRPDVGEKWNPIDFGSYNPLHSTSFLTRKDEWPKVQESLYGYFNPVVLCLIRSSGPSGSYTDHHQVVAYGHEDLAGGIARLFIYDCNQRGADARPRDDVWVDFTTSGEWRISQNTEERVRGFIAAPRPPRPNARADSNNDAYNKRLGDHCLWLLRQMGRADWAENIENSAAADAKGDKTSAYYRKRMADHTEWFLINGARRFDLWNQIEASARADVFGPVT